MELFLLLVLVGIIWISLGINWWKENKKESFVFDYRKKKLSKVKITKIVDNEFILFGNPRIKKHGVTYRVDDNNKSIQFWVDSEVESIQKLSTWTFQVVFTIKENLNCYVVSSNNNSSIPEHIKDKIKIAVETELLKVNSQADYLHKKRLEAHKKYKKYMEIECDSAALLSKTYDEIKEAIYDAGFFNVKKDKIYDFRPGKPFKLGDVCEVKIEGKNYFTKLDRFSYNSTVYIICHEKEQCTVIRSSKDYIGKHYTVANSDFVAAGFTVSYNTVKTNIFNRSKVNNVKSITINGKDTFNAGDKFYYDANIVISYYS
jgi:hypothetical protein